MTKQQILGVEGENNSHRKKFVESTGGADSGKSPSPLLLSKPDVRLSPHPALYQFL